MGKFVKGCAAVMVGLVLLVGIIFWATSGVTGTADEFIEHLAQGQHDEAYAMFGPKVTSELTREDFDGFLTGTRLGQAESASWGSRSFRNNTGEVSGDISLSDGGTKAVTVYLEKIDDKWMIQGIKFTDQSEDEAEVVAYKATADEFLAHVSKAEMDQAYALCGESVRKDVDLAGLQSMMEASRLTATEKVEWNSNEPTNFGSKLSGVATLTDGNKVDLDLTLQDIDGKWLVQGFNYRHQTAPTELEAPSSEECKTLTKDFLAALAAYMDKKDAEPLNQICYSALAAKFKNSEALDQFLAAFPDQAVLRGLLDQPFVFTEVLGPPKDGVFKIKARSEVDQNGVYLLILLDYGAEENAWKLVNMNLKTRLAAEQEPPPAVE
jgi:hypothetical protein